jgi:hypothetical protein
MSRTMVNFLLDASLLLIFVVLVSIGTIIRFVFPPGPDSRGWQLWGLGYDQWSTIQFGTIALLAMGILIHVMLHWSWVCGVIASRTSRHGKKKFDEGVQTIYGVGLLIVIVNIVGLAIAAAALTVQASR